MKNLLIGVCALLVVACELAIAVEPTSAIVNVSWTVLLDVDGHVTELSTGDKRVPKLHALLEKAIRGWRFSPGKIDGKPALTQTHLHTELEVRLVNDAFEVRLLGASTGGEYGKKTLPLYPSSAAKGHKQGLVMLAVHYDEGGAVTSVQPFDTHLGVDDRLVQAAVSAVKKWTFAPETVGGHAIAGDSAVPVCFHLDVLPEPVCNWKNPATGTSTDGSQSVALNPAAKLESDVIGHTL